MKLRRAIGAVLVCTLASAGCSTAYMPRPSSRVQVIMKGGTPAYVRDGKVYEGGIFGGDLDEAVRGNPDAESHAKTYQNSMIGGFLATLAGGVSTGGGLVLLAADASQSSSDRSTSRQTLAGSLIVGGIAAYVVGIVLLSTAQPHHWDAINVYNDGIPDGARLPYAPPYGPAPAYAPPGAAPPPQPPPPPPPVLPPPRAR